MKKTLTPALVLVLGSVVLGATVFREQVARAAPGIQDVFVTNSTREPVPVHEQGTADVSVTNATLGVHEQGTADVNVTNAPLAVRTFGEQPVQRRLTFQFDWSVCFASDGYIVPAGKHLRIEQVTFLQAQNQDFIKKFEVVTDLPGGQSTTHYLGHTKDGVSELTRIYASPGSHVVFLGLISPASPLCGHATLGSFSGVLIDAP